MNSMNFIVWMLPVLFMSHDFEEIIMAEAWHNRYQKEIQTFWPKNQPFGLNYIRCYPTPTMSSGVFIEFVLYSLISFLSAATQHHFIWYAFFLGFAIHLVFIHMLLCIRFRHYIPGVTTAVIFLGPTIWYLIDSAEILHYNLIMTALAFLCGLVLMLVLIPIIHKLMGPMSTLIQKYSNKNQK
jgi:hypothetical protein